MSSIYKAVIFEGKGTVTTLFIMPYCLDPGCLDLVSHLIQRGYKTGKGSQMRYSTAFLLGLTRLLEQGSRGSQKGLVTDLCVLLTVLA